MSLFPQNDEPVIPQHINILKSMRMNNQRLIEMKKHIFDMNYRNFWCTREIAEAILAELGTEAWDWFVQSYQEQLAIKSLDPTWEIKVAPYEYTKHDDGRVTLN